MSSITLFWVITAAIFSSIAKLQYSDTPGVVLAEEQPYITKFTPSIINQYQINIRMYECSKKLVTYKEYSCFDHSDFPAHSMFTSDVCWGSLGTSIFGNSSSVANHTRSRLPSRLSFRFLWLCCYRVFSYTAAQNNCH